jgi:NAD(P)-dependent dehydrogenase (short-subunit alcohol dehydrogenase family)
VAEEGDIDAAVAVAVDEFGGLDSLFNNAGNPGSVGGILEIDMVMFDRTVAIHLRGVFLGIRAAARVMRPQGHGSIINTSSVAGLAANYGGHDYSACKSAIAEAALWLAGDSSTFVNGQAIAVDGGLTTGPLYRQAHAQIDGLMQILQAPGT